MSEDQAFEDRLHHFPAHRKNECIQCLQGQLKDLRARCSASVVEAMVEFPNVHEYVAQLEAQRDEALAALARAESPPQTPDTGAE